MHRPLRFSLPIVLMCSLACAGKDEPKQDAKQNDAKADKQAPTPTPEPSKPAPTSDDAYVLVPGESIAAIRIGMPKADVEALGILKPHPQFSAMTIPISVIYDEAGAAKILEISLMRTDKDVKIGDVTIAKGASVDQAREALGDCEEPEVAIGGTMYPCRGGALKVAIGSGDPTEVWLRIGD